MTRIRRGSVYVSAERGAYTGKPRPFVVIQNTNVQLDSVIVIPLTTFDADGSPIRIEIAPTRGNGLKKPSFAMCDKITVIPRKNLGDPVGALGDEALNEIAAALAYLISEDDELEQAD